MEHQGPIANLPTISAKEIHADHLRAFRIGNRARLELSRGIRILARTGGFKEVRFGPIFEYAYANFGFGQSTTKEYIRVAEALETLPSCAESFQAGKVCWSSRRAITRVAKPNTEKEWATFAEENPVHRVIAEASDAEAKGQDLPRKGAGGLPRQEIQMAFSFSLEEYQIVKQAFAKSREEMRASLGGEVDIPSKEVFLFMAKAMLRTDPLGTPEGRKEREDSIFTVLYRICDECGRSWIQTDEGPSEVPREHVARLEETANRVKIRPEEELPEEPKERRPAPDIDRKCSRSLRRKVLLREGLVCANPMCRRRHGLQAHHEEERSRGGRTILENLGGFCPGCHSLLTAGLLEAHRDEDGRMVVIRKPDLIRKKVLEDEERALAAMPRIVVEAKATCVADGLGDSVSKERRDDVILALRKIGFRKEEATARVDRAIERFRKEGQKPSDDDLFRAAASGA
jgi:hypothetical protein